MRWILKPIKYYVSQGLKELVSASYMKAKVVNITFLQEMCIVGQKYSLHCSQITVVRHVDVNIFVNNLPSMPIGCKQNQTKK